MTLRPRARGARRGRSPVTRPWLLAEWRACRPAAGGPPRRVGAARRAARRARCGTRQGRPWSLVRAEGRALTHGACLNPGRVRGRDPEGAAHAHGDDDDRLDAARARTPAGRRARRCVLAELECGQLSLQCVHCGSACLPSCPTYAGAGSGARLAARTHLPSSRPSRTADRALRFRGRPSVALSRLPGVRERLSLGRAVRRT